MGLQPIFQVALLFSMRTELLVPLHRCLSIDVDAWCKRALNNETCQVVGCLMGDLQPPCFKVTLV